MELVSWSMKPTSLTPKLQPLSLSPTQQLILIKVIQKGPYVFILSSIPFWNGHVGDHGKRGKLT